MVEIRDRHTAVSDPEQWLARIGSGRRADDRALIARACALAAEAYGGELRASGEPYLRHPLAVASILHELGMDHETLAAAILHDLVADGAVDPARIEADFGPAVARLVEGVGRMNIIRDLPGPEASAGHDSAQADALRKLLLAMAEDVRVVLIKLAERLHDLRSRARLPDGERQRIARETLDLYAPLASRLGIWQIKWELEDLAFRYLDPETYKSIARQIDERRVDREAYIGEVVSRLSAELADAGIQATVSGRPKHIHSIWRKMQLKGLDFQQLFDVRAVRVMVESVADCYAALGVVHTLWQHVPGEFDDYITAPKRNFYQSLHTAVIGPGGKTLEIQIRTQDMHRHAELGVAAHWRYKEQAGRDQSTERRIAWLRQLLESKDDPRESGELLERFRTEVLHDRVYVMTPKGRVVDLPRGATPLDFAYHVHTEVGHRCRGAKVDGQMVPLTYALRSGQQVDILTTRNGTPSRDWLNPHLGYLATARARGKVRHWFRQQDHDKNVVAGREALERELKRLGLPPPNLDQVARRFNYVRGTDLLAGIGNGDITTAQVAGALQDTVPRPEKLPLAAPSPAAGAVPEGGIRVQGVGNLLTQMARCCKPVPNDPVVGYITRGRGVTVHRSDCRNVLRLTDDERRRLVDVSWSARPEQTYPVDVHLVAYDRQGLLRDITTVIANEKMNVRALDFHTETRTHTVQVDLTIEVTDLAQLSRVLDRVTRLPNVLEAERRR